MTSKLKIAAAGAVLAASMAMPAFAQPLPGANPVQILPGAGMVEQAKICRPHTVSVRRCIRRHVMICRYRVTVFCTRKVLGCRPTGRRCGLY